MLIAILCMLIAALCTGFHAWLVKPALDQVLIESDKFYLYFIPIAILVTGIIKGLVSYLQVVSLQFMSHRIIEKLRKDVFHNIINLHYGFFVKNKTNSESAEHKKSGQNRRFYQIDFLLERQFF